MPIILGAAGVERIVEIDLTDAEKAGFQNSVEAVKELVKTMGELLAS